MEVRFKRKVEDSLSGDSYHLKANDQDLATKSKSRIGIKARNIGSAESEPETEKKYQFQGKGLRVGTKDRDHKSYTIL